MPARNYSGGLPFRARVKTAGIETYLGHFATYDEAVRAEQAWRERRGLPHFPQKSHPKIVQVTT